MESDTTLIAADPIAASREDRAQTPTSEVKWARFAAAILALLAAAGLALAYTIAYDQAAAALERDAHATARLQVAVLQSELGKQRAAPVILAEDSDVIHALETPSPARGLAISAKLAKLQRETGSAAIYLINRDGEALSSSNYAEPTSFVGSNYNFRAYFQEGLENGQAEQFALGTVSRRPGLYIAHRVEADGRALGVVVVKVQFDRVEGAWAREGATTFVTDAAGAVLLTSRPALRFHKLPVGLANQIDAVVAAPLPGWRLHLLVPRKQAVASARSTTLMAGLIEALALVLVGWLWRRRRRVAERAAAEQRYRERLESDVDLRTRELRDANARLSAEIRERRQTERRLNVLQADLVQANKLAQLGQITAGVAHEINQPLATIRVLAENALALLNGRTTKPASEMVGENLGSIVRMSERIGHITSELRAFSRKATGETEPVLLRETLESSILLNGSRLRDNRVRLVCERIDPQLRVIAGRIRLEQVVVNLLQNAFEALETTADPEVRISVESDAAWVRLRIRDNGPGLDPKVMTQLFTPFVTTKEKGLGLGLVIAHDILRDFGGELTAENAASGAILTLKLKKAPR
jgi:two-component system C4-dicarboxylate transport sensor histidine kinase DctB